MTLTWIALDLGNLVFELQMAVTILVHASDPVIILDGQIGVNIDNPSVWFEVDGNVKAGGHV